MCGPKPPKAPPTPAPRQAPRAPDQAAISSRSQELLDRRTTMAMMAVTDPNGLGAAPTAGKRVLGA